MPRLTERINRHSAESAENGSAAETTGQRIQCARAHQLDVSTRLYGTAGEKSEFNDFTRNWADNRMKEILAVSFHSAAFQVYYHFLFSGGTSPFCVCIVMIQLVCIHIVAVVHGWIFQSPTELDGKRRAPQSAVNMVIPFHRV